MERKALLVSAIAALVTVALLRTYMHRFELEAAGGPKRLVVVLLRDLEAGATLERDALGSRELPEAYVESRHVAAHDLDRLLGLELAVPGRAGETLLWSDLESLRRGSPRLSSLVPEGKRAMTLTPRSGGADALLEPGDHIDVLSTRAEASADRPARTELVADSLLVLAVGELASSAGGSRSGVRRGGITVAVTPDQGRALAEAELASSLRLVLRNPDDSQD